MGFGLVTNTQRCPSARELLATGGRRSLGPSAWGRSPRRVRSEEGGRILIKIFPFSDPTALRAYLRAPALWLARRSMAMTSKNSVVLSLLHTANEGRRGPTERNTVCGHCTAVPKLAVDKSHSTRTRLERRDDRSGSTSRQQQHSCPTATRFVYSTHWRCRTGTRDTPACLHNTYLTRHNALGSSVWF